jgi:hypothetical protein
MITADRYVARSINRDEWLAARRGGVTATEVAAAATESGFAQVVQRRLHPYDEPENEFMAFGKESEAIIMRHAHQELGVVPNDWLFAFEDEPRFMATPDGHSPDFNAIGECKTGAKVPKSIPRPHRDQMFWQMAAVGASGGWYLFNQRVPDAHGGFYLGLIEPIVMWLDRDNDRIRELRDVAYRLLGATNG